MLHLKELNQRLVGTFERANVGTLDVPHLEIETSRSCVRGAPVKEPGCQNRTNGALPRKDRRLGVQRESGRLAGDVG